MGVIDAMIERRSMVVNPLHPRDPALAEWFGGGNTTAAGENVTPLTAMQESAVLACGRYIGETIASLPLPMFERDRNDPRRKTRALGEPLYERLHDQPNRWHTSFEWRDLLMNHVIYRGNFYCRLVPSRELPPFELVPLHPDRVEPFWAPNGERAYKYDPPPGQRRELVDTLILQSEMFHLPFMPDDGLKGVSVITHARETIGRALAAAKFAAKLYENEGMPAGVLTYEKKLGRDTRDAMREEWEKRRYSTRGQRKVAILQDGLKFDKVGISPEDAQHVQEMQYNKSDIAGIFMVKPHKIGDMSRATFSNIEQQAIESVVDTIRPWCVRFEQRAKLDLLTPGQRSRFFFEFVVDGLLRGDSAARGDFYGKMWNIGVFSENDINELENRPPREGGDERWIPLNMRPLSQVLAEPPAPRPAPAPRTGPDYEARTIAQIAGLRRAYQPLFADAAGRLLRREADQIERQFRRMVQARSTRSIGDFEVWLRDFYATFGETAGQALLPVVLSYSEAVRSSAVDDVGGDADAVDLAAFSGSYAGAYGARHAGASQTAIEKVLRAGEPALVIAGVDELLGRWRDSRADDIANEETVKASGAIARETWRQVGVTKLRWVSGGGCPLCQELNGQVVGIEQEFLREGDLLTPEGVTEFKATKTLHPPLHRGCDCSVVAEIE